MKNKGYKRLVLVGFFTLATVFIWICLDSYQQLTRGEEIEKAGDLIAPLSPDLKTEVLDRIEAKKEYQLEEIDSYLKLVPEPTLTGVPSQAVLSQEATEGGKVIR